jgi:alanyl-tRNA synthetase
VLDSTGMTLGTTQRLYYDDSFGRDFHAEVLSCVPFKPEAESAASVPAWGLILDRTLFYPTSGGQPHDCGRIGEASVLDVLDDGDLILHVVDKPLPAGSVKGSVDWVRRFDHMQQHTGQHLLSAVFLERHGLPTVSFHLGAELSTIDLRGSEPSPTVLEAAEHACNQIIFENRHITVRYGTSKELSQMGVRKQVDRTGILRAIEIEGIDLQPCGGTHLKSTGQIGLLLIRRCTKIRQDWRVEFVCGQRARSAGRADFQLLRRAAERLNCAPVDMISMADRVLSERDTLHKAVQLITLRLAVAEASVILHSTPSSPNGTRLISRVLQGVEPGYLAPFATQLTQAEKTVALLVHQDSGHLVFAQHPSAGMDMNSLLRQVLEKLGGKGGGTRDFARGRLNNASQSAQALDAARGIVQPNTTRTESPVT